MGNACLLPDPYFGDDRIRQYGNRPFSSAAQMDAELIRRWNESVKDSDTVYLLGDFGAAGREAQVLAQLHGRKLLIRGNRDHKRRIAST